MKKAIKRLNLISYVNPFEVKFKIIILFASFLYVIGLFAYVLKDFRTEDEIPAIQAINLDMRKQFRDLSAVVRTGMYIKNFPTFDFTNNSFSVDALVWFEFTKNELMLKTVEKFTFENATIKQKSSPHVSIQGDKILAKYDIVFDVKTDLNFQRFPLDDHRLSMVLTNEFVSPAEMYFDDDADATSFSVSPDIFISNWYPYQLHATPGYSSIKIDEHRDDRRSSHPKIAFTVDFAKRGINRILIIFVPLLATIFFALFTFLMSFNNHSGKTTLSVTAITAILGYRFVIQQMSPPVGYFTITDKIYLFFLLFALMVFIFQLVLLRQYLLLMDREKIKKAEIPTEDRQFYTPKITERINSVVYLLSIAIFITGITWIIVG